MCQRRTAASVPMGGVPKLQAHGQLLPLAVSLLLLSLRSFRFYCVSLSLSPMHYDRMLSVTVISIASRLVGWNNAIDSSIDALSLDAWWCCTNAVNKLPRYIIACAFDCKRFMTRSVPSGALGGRRFAL